MQRPQVEARTGRKRRCPLDVWQGWLLPLQPPPNPLLPCWWLRSVLPSLGRLCRQLRVNSVFLFLTSAPRCSQSFDSKSVLSLVVHTPVFSSFIRGIIVVFIHSEAHSRGSLPGVVPHSVTAHWGPSVSAHPLVWEHSKLTRVQAVGSTSGRWACSGKVGEGRRQ